MKICDFTEPELAHFRVNCNFTDEEKIYFEARSRGYSNVKIAIDNYWSESKVSYLARKVKKKIERII